MYSSLITAAALAQHYTDSGWVVVDCRFDLFAKDAGREAYRHAHIPGAVYAHLDADLCGPPTTDHGRHPLPPPARLAASFSRLGIGSQRQVVAYDGSGGWLAARLWWLLRYMGHTAVAVLDGGWSAWLAAGLPQAAGEEPPTPARFSGQAQRDRLVVLAEVSAQTGLVDAREPARFRGEHEPIDKRAGHIPQARNHCWKLNLDGDGTFLQPAQLRKAFLASLGTLPDARTVHYCGSGVSACHNILAQVHAGLPEPRLYCGSWSEWCADPARPVATGGDRDMHETT